jgi:transposase
MAAAEAALAYKGLWQVEQAFRTLKTPLELRPIYHLTERRVRGHITVCFLAFTLRQILKQRLAEQAFDGSFSKPALSKSSQVLHCPLRRGNSTSKMNRRGRS